MVPSTPTGPETTVTFEYGLTASYGQTVVPLRVLLELTTVIIVVSHTLMDWNQEHIPFQDQGSKFAGNNLFGRQNIHNTVRKVGI